MPDVDLDEGAESPHAVAPPPILPTTQASTSRLHSSELRVEPPVSKCATRGDGGSRVGPWLCQEDKTVVIDLTGIFPTQIITYG
jgi:hypothetical protein